MPFRALDDGEVVAPAMVAGRQPVECPECGGTMYTRSGGDIARHFYHRDPKDTDTCSLTFGESELHHRCKALALAALKRQWSEQSDRYGVEMALDVSFTPTDPDRRVADALVEFASRNPYFGQGLIIEVQHKHHEKDLRRVTYDYISADYSVAWVSPDHFDEEQLDYSVVDTMFAEYGPSTHDWQGGEPIEAGHAITPRDRVPHTLGPVPADLETYRNYPNPRTDVSEHRWSFMKNPWQ